MTQREFNDQWTIEEMPACDRGMVLLKAWAEATPDAPEIPALLELAQSRIRPRVAIEEWWAFVVHMNQCDHCNER